MVVGRGSNSSVGGNSGSNRKTPIPCPSPPRLNFEQMRAFPKGSQVKSETLRCLLINLRLATELINESFFVGKDQRLSNLVMVKDDLITAVRYINEYKSWCEQSKGKDRGKKS